MVGYGELKTNRDGTIVKRKNIDTIHKSCLEKDITDSSEEIPRGMKL